MKKSQALNTNVILVVLVAVTAMALNSCEIGLNPFGSDYLQVTGISITPSTLTLKEGRTILVNATPNGHPDYGFNIGWEGCAVASVYRFSHMSKTEAYVFAEKAGTGKIYAKYNWNSDISDSAIVTVLPAIVQSVTFSVDSVQIKVGQYTELHPRVIDNEGVLIPRKNFIWASSDTSIAIVEEDLRGGLLSSAFGFVRGRKPGPTIISASTDGFTAKVNVTVLPW